MEITSKFAENNKVFFKASNNCLSLSGIEIFDRLVEGNFGSAQIKAYIIKDLMLHYTFNRFVKPTDFILSADREWFVNRVERFPTILCEY